ncbi:hypothetical protein COLO4_35708 [Corchorus olitorius]|uniref:Uncharacterized protein n=1 Tax=Corchorus olitorius TaxID=93759 RepID=A0A1R3GDZ2_9ROSI|nr:hypothetical protein COLO4_35708 [Corchorus olitorius]
MLGAIELVEAQFRISYPSNTLAASPEFRQDPSLINIIHIVLKVVQDYTPCGKYGSTLIMLWLDLIGNVDVDSICLPALVQHLNSTDRYISFDIMGEVKRALVLTTSPISMASLYTAFTLNHDEGSTDSTLHKLIIALHKANEQAASPNMHVLRILIFNAGGVQNPAFLPVFSWLFNEHNPHMALVTETRLSGAQARHRRLSLDFPESSILDSIGYFGGDYHQRSAYSDT